MAGTTGRLFKGIVGFELLAVAGAYGLFHGSSLSCLLTLCPAAYSTCARADCDWTHGGVVNTGSLNSSPSFRVRCSEWAPFVVGGFYQIADSINPGAAELARKQDAAFRSAQRPG